MSKIGDSSDNEPMVADIVNRIDNAIDPANDIGQDWSTTTGRVPLDTVELVWGMSVFVLNWLFSEPPAGFALVGPKNVHAKLPGRGKLWPAP